MKIIQGDSLAVLKTLPDESIDCCITSPPYFGLRDYGVEGQIGLEDTPEAFTEKLVDVFREVRRVLKNNGTLWLNLGDSYAGSGKGQTREGSQDPRRGKTNGMKLKNSSKGFEHTKPKDLIGIPWMVAFALRQDGWYLRQDIIWYKPNTMPESVTDRCTKSHEYVFLLSKLPIYYYDIDAIREPFLWGDDPRNVGDGTRFAYKDTAKSYSADAVKQRTKTPAVSFPVGGKNKRSVWSVNLHPYNESHSATFPEKLVEPMILAGCPKGGTVLDPFSGAATTGVVSKKLGRDYIGIELNPEYVKLSEERIARVTPPMF